MDNKSTKEQIIENYEAEIVYLSEELLTGKIDDETYDREIAHLKEQIKKEFTDLDT